MSNEKHVIGIFDNRRKAQSALDSIVERGVGSEKLSLLVSQSGKDHHLEIDKDKSKTAEGVGYGAVFGGLVAGLGALASGIASVTVPGAIFITGPLAIALTAGAAGATVGGLAGGLIGIGIPADEVNLIEEELGKGSIVVAVHSINAEEEKMAKEVFKAAEAVRVH